MPVAFVKAKANRLYLEIETELLLQPKLGSRLYLLIL